MSTTTTLEPLTRFRAWLTGVDGEGLTDADRLVLIGALEELKAVTTAAQVRVTEAFDTSQRCAHVLAGVTQGRRLGRSGPNWRWCCGVPRRGGMRFVTWRRC